MNLVYFIIAHKNPQQLAKLINGLLSGNTYIIIHIDKKSKIDEFLFIREMQPGHIFFIENRRNIIWGGISQVNATLEMIKFALEQNIQFEYAILISGQDFPILTQEGIRKFLNKRKGKNFIDYNRLPFHRWGFNGGIDRVSYYWFVESLGTKLSRVLYVLQKAFGLKRKSIYSGNLYGGSQWWTLTREALTYIMQAGYEGSGYYKRYKQTSCADEIYFQTLLLNSPLKDDMIGDNLRYIDWDKGPQYPRLLDESDFENIIKSRKHFARKVEENSRIIDLLERHLKEA